MALIVHRPPSDAVHLDRLALLELGVAQVAGNGAGCV